MKIMWGEYVKIAFDGVLSIIYPQVRFKRFQLCHICIWWRAIKKRKIAKNVGKYFVTEETEKYHKKKFHWFYICIWWRTINNRKIAKNVGKYFVTEETEETSEKTTCTGNQPWTARLVENILNTGETEDTPQKTTCTGHSRVAQFVENILDLEETEDTPEKITCTGFQHWKIEVEPRGGRKYKCVLCDFTAERASGVRLHMAGMHTTLEQLDGCTDYETEMEFELERERMRIRSGQFNRYYPK